MRFDIRPHIGALPITFGMNREQVHDLIGQPESSFPIWDGSGVSENYKRMRCNVGYDTAGMVNHIGFSPGGVDLAIDGRPIWSTEGQPDPNPILLALDPEPLEFVGFWIFLAVGVTTTGYHDDDPGQRAVTVFPQGSKANLLAEATPADTSRYRRWTGEAG